MNVRTIAKGVGAAAVLSVAAAAQASSIGYQNSGGNISGNVDAFDGSGFNSISEAFQASFDGTGAFSGAGFGSDTVNVFFVDFSGAGGSAADAGLTLFVNWGNSSTPGGIDLSGSGGTFNLQVGPGGDVNNPAAGVNEVFSFGSSALSDFGQFSVFSETSPTDLPTGFVLTNFNFGSGGALAPELILNFAGLVGIEEWALFSAGNNQAVFGGNDGTDGGENTVVLVIPLPAPVWIGLAGLLGVGVLRKRIVA